MLTNLSNLSRLLDVPATDPDDARRRRLLKFSWFSLLFSRRLRLFYKCLSAHALTPSRIYLSGDNLLYWYGGLATWILCAIVYALNRSPRVPGWVAGNVFLLGIMVLFAFLDTPV